MSKAINKSLLVYFLLLLSLSVKNSFANESESENSANTTIDKQEDAETSNSQTQILSPPCMMFPGINFTRNPMISLYDGQSINKEELQSVPWNLTKSLYVADGCMLTICNEVQSDGSSGEDTSDTSCEDISEGKFLEMSENLQQMTYAKCFCTFEHVNYRILSEIKHTIEEQSAVIQEIKDKVDLLQSSQANTPSPSQTSNAGGRRHRYRRSTETEGETSTTTSTITSTTTVPPTTEKPAENSCIFPNTFSKSFSILENLLESTSQNPITNTSNNNIPNIGFNPASVFKLLFETFENTAEKMHAKFEAATKRMQEEQLKFQKERDARWEELVREQKEEKAAWNKQQEPHFAEMARMGQDQRSMMENYNKAAQNHLAQQQEFDRVRMANMQWDR